jgi:RNA polymerase sigma-70 factor (ECF subfamily)
MAAITALGNHGEERCPSIFVFVKIIPGVISVAFFMDLDKQREVFEAIALPHLDALYGFALVLTKQPTEAEDLVQDTYVRALQFFHRYEPGTNCKAWLFTMMKHIFLNQAPQRAREVLCPDQSDHDGEENAGSLDYYASLADHPPGGKDEVFRQDVVKALELLPDSFCVVVVLHDVEGFSYSEIAQMLDCPMGTVMSRLARGRDILRQLLCAYANQDSRKPVSEKRIAPNA